MGEYVKDMRKLIGHRPLMICGASVIVENEQGDILLQKREDDGTWGYAGGSVELYEEVEAAAARELYEESGLIAEELEFFYVNSGREVHYIYPNGDEVSNIEIIYTCKKYHGEIKKATEEMEELRFFDPQEIRLEMISEPIRPVIREYLKRTDHLLHTV